MKKEKILKILLLLLFLLLSSYLIFLGYQNHSNSSNDFDKSEDKNNYNHFSVEGLNFEHCKNEMDDRCRYANNTLRYINLDVSYKKIKEVTQDINKIVSQKYNEILSSNLDSDECTEVREIYNYRKIYMMAEHLYESNDLISIFYELYGVDICTDKNFESLYNSYVYDIKKDKFLTNEDLLKLYDVDDSYIKSAIHDNILYWNDTLSTNYSDNDIDDNYLLYISNDGALNVFYTNRITNKSYNVLLKDISS